METIIKYKRGDVREDGMVLWARYRGTKETWVTQEKFDENKKRHALREKKFRDNNKDLLKIRRKENRIKNIEIFREKQSEYRKKSKHLRTANHAKRRSLKKQSSVLLTKSQKQIIDCFYAQAHRLENRIGIKFHVDHIVPLSKGGLHSPTNLQTIPATLNISKNCHRIFTWREL